MLILRAIINAHLTREKLPIGKKSNHAALYHISGGGCDICTQEMRRLYAPEDAAHSYQFNFVETPFEADAMILTGALTRVALDDILRVWAVMPSPGAFMAVGDCARGRDSMSGHYAVIKSGLARMIPDVRERQFVIRGCPPKAHDIAQGLVALCAEMHGVAVPR